MKNLGFKEQLAFGRIAESRIAFWLRRKGYVVMPAYEIEIDSGKGPQLFWGEADSAVAPDLLAIKGHKVKWVEAKHKSVFTWHRLTKHWTTGIDRRHYTDYLRIAQKVPWEIWLLFLHVHTIPDSRDMAYCPDDCPTGLYAGEVRYLSRHENHRHDNWGNSGMVYWAESTLIKLAVLDEI